MPAFLGLYGKVAFIVLVALEGMCHAFSYFDAELFELGDLARVIGKQTYLRESELTEHFDCGEEDPLVILEP